MLSDSGHFSPGPCSGLFLGLEALKPLLQTSYKFKSTHRGFTYRSSRPSGEILFFTVRLNNPNQDFSLALEMTTFLPSVANHWEGSARARITLYLVIKTWPTSKIEMPTARWKTFFAYFLLPIRQKVRRLSGRVPTVLFIYREKPNKVVGTLPDRRLAFFTGLKKGSKERTIAGSGHLAYNAGSGFIC